jgi:murein DD-endopeptidase MepM/ murein hydrolase activator NlpD
MRQDANDVLAATSILRPVPGEATSRYGKRISPITKQEETHTGVDLSAALGTEIKSAIQGTVLEVKKNDTSF